LKKGAGYHHGNLRRALVEATTKLVDSRGTDGFTLRAAAKLAGVSDGAPYHHFADKEALLAAVAEEGFLLLHDDMCRAADRAEKNPLSQSWAMGIAYVLFAVRYPARFRLMFGPLGLDGKRHPDLARAAARAAGFVKDSLARGLGGDGRNAPDHLWLGAWALVHGLSVLAVDGHLGSAGRSTRRLSRLVLGTMQSLNVSGQAQRETDAPRSGRRLKTSRERSSTTAARR
jgi:AcrR family transcriptional regulator